MDRERAEEYAKHWAEAWNRRDLDAILVHFADGIVFSSPRALEAVGTPTVRGKAALRRYWEIALERARVLHFAVERVLWDGAASELAILYDREIDGRRDRAVEILRFGDDGKVVRGEVLYGVEPAPAPLQRFAEYAAAFERTYADDDWGRLEQYFAGDATYRVDGGAPLGGAWQGRAAVLAQLRASVNGLDRRFDERQVELVGAPREGGDWVEVGWRSTYRKAGLPDLVFAGLERAEFAGSQIRALEDRLEASADEQIRAYLARYFG